ncbi:MAG: VOC family protein [Alphaproteobacteria bacterium]|nr:VOC family protein [Alphaproteobacteria bacterium]
MPVVSGLKSVVLTSDDVDTTAAFYRDVLDVPLEVEHHTGTHRHWAGMLDGVHVAVHPRQGFWLPSAVDGRAEATVVSFETDDLPAFEARLAERGVPVVARNRIGPMDFVAVVDPDGRHVCCGTRWPARRQDG